MVTSKLHTYTMKLSIVKGNEGKKERKEQRERGRERESFLTVLPHLNISSRKPQRMKVSMLSLFSSKLSSYSFLLRDQSSLTLVFVNVRARFQVSGFSAHRQGQNRPENFTVMESEYWIRKVR